MRSALTITVQSSSQHQVSHACSKHCRSAKTHLTCLQAFIATQAASASAPSVTEADREPEAEASAPTPASTTPALDQLSADCLKRAFKLDADTEKHPTTLAFESHIGATILELADFWFCQGSPYDHICLARANWREFSSCWRLGELFTRAEFHVKLYAYTLRRTCAIKILLERGYEILDDGLSATDVAFGVVVEALVLNWEDLMPHIQNWPERGRKRMVMIDHPRLLRAVEIVIGGRVPMRFHLKRTEPLPEWAQSVGKGNTKTRDILETAFFSFEEDGKGSWETEMEIVPKAEEDLICNGGAYELGAHYR